MQKREETNSVIKSLHQNLEGNMQTSGIKIDINSSDKLLFDESAKIEKVIKFAVKQAVVAQKKTGKSGKIKKINK